MTIPSDSSLTRKDFALSPDLPGADQVTAVDAQTILIQGETGPLTNIASLPRAGGIYIAYEYQDVPARSIYLRRQGGGTEPIRLGWNFFTVNVGDMIWWTLASPVNSIKIAWQYTS
jgi:hypothetical protein